MHITKARGRLAAALLATFLPLMGCAQPAGTATVADRHNAGAARHRQAPAVDTAGAPHAGWAGHDPGRPGPRWTVSPPSRRGVRHLVPRLLAVQHDALPAVVLRRVHHLPHVQGALPVSLAAVPMAGRRLTVAAADLNRLRGFTPARTAAAHAVWVRAASGELVLRSDVAARLPSPLGERVSVRRHGGGSLRVGAVAPLPPPVQAVVNPRLGAHLGLPAPNALLLAAPPARTARTLRELRSLLGAHATVHRLSPPRTGVPTRAGTDIRRPRTHAAVLSGGSVAAAVGSFRYHYLPDGTVRPDPRWVTANIRTGQVPVLGTVTCHRQMLPRLRWALAELVDRGLADALDPADYGGCYVPRFIGHDPDRGLSLHTWGIAIDLNVSTNQPGTSGSFPPSIVAVFKKWGFAWGGDWTYPDPMHFELAVLTRPAH